MKRPEILQRFQRIIIAPSMYGVGESVGAVVLEIGSGLTKVGYAGENIPKSIFDSVVGSGGVFQESLALPRPQVDLVHPVVHGQVANSDAWNQLASHAITQQLKCDASEHPILLSESVYTSKAERERMAAFLFEELASPALFLAKDSLLAALAVGKTTAIVLQVGAGVTSCVPIHEGYVLSTPARRSKVAGDALASMMCTTYESAPYNAKIQPRFTIKRGFEGDKRVYHPVDTPGLTESYYSYGKSKVCQDLFESVCRVNDTFFNAAEHANIPTMPYELPDGQILAVGPDRLSVPEVLFAPSAAVLAMLFPPQSPGNSGGVTAGNPAETPSSDRVAGFADFDDYVFPGVANMVHEVVNACDVDLHRDMLSTIVTSGGVSALGGFSERLAVSLEAITPPAAKVKVVAAGSGTLTEKKYGSWVGGSILGSLGTFQQMWVSKSEYEEYGAEILATRCP